MPSLFYRWRTADPSRCNSRCAPWHRKDSGDIHLLSAHSHHDSRVQATKAADPQAWEETSLGFLVNPGTACLEVAAHIVDGPQGLRLNVRPRHRAPPPPLWPVRPLRHRPQIFGTGPMSCTSSLTVISRSNELPICFSESPVL